MDYLNIQKLIAGGESLTVEFKKAADELPKSLFETICAFLNRQGGTVLLGVADDKTIVGVDPSKAEALCKDISNLSNNDQKLSPSFLLNATVVTFKEKTLIHVYVPESSQVHRCCGKVYDRSADGDYVLKSHLQLKQLYTRKSTHYSETTIYPFLDETHFVPGIVEKARTIIKAHRAQHPWNDLSDRDFFITSGLYRTDLSLNQQGFTLAALLLFGREEMIQSAIPHYKMDALLRRDDLDRYDDRDTIRCNLIDAFDRLMAFVAKHLPDKFYLEGHQRISLRELIFREIIANFLIHREYTNAYPATLIIYKDRLETKNANRPHSYGTLTPGSFEPFPKNPNLAKLFAQMGRAEDLGTGISKVFKSIHAYTGESRVEFLDDDLFTVRVMLGRAGNEGTHESVSESVNEGVNESVNEKPEVLGLLRGNPKLTRYELAGILKVGVATIDRQLCLLKKNEAIRRVGADKNGHWEVL